LSERLLKMGISILGFMTLINKDQKMNILYVDNEKDSLSSFRAVFRRDYNIFTCSQPLRVPLLIYKNNIKVVLSDQSMPFISGIDLFTFLKIENEDVIRILVTGSVFEDKKQELIENDIIHAWVNKPWEKEKLQHIISTLSVCV